MEHQYAMHKIEGTSFVVGFDTAFRADRFLSDQYVDAAKQAGIPIGEFVGYSVIDSATSFRIETLPRVASMRCTDPVQAVKLAHWLQKHIGGSVAVFWLAYTPVMLSLTGEVRRDLSRVYNNLTAEELEINTALLNAPSV